MEDDLRFKAYASQVQEMLDDRRPTRMGIKDFTMIAGALVTVGIVWNQVNYHSAELKGNAEVIEEAVHALQAIQISLSANIREDEIMHKALSHRVDLLESKQ